MAFDIERNLVNHRPSVQTQAVMEAVREQAHHYAAALDSLVADSREKLLALTNLEQSLQWAMAALARADFDQVRLATQRSDNLADAGLDPK